MPLPEQAIHGHTNGIKAFLLTDSMLNYVLNVHLLGAEISSDFVDLSLPTQLVLQLIKPLHLSNRTITAPSSWYTSIELVYELASYDCAYVGPMTKRQQQIPRDFIHELKHQPIGSAKYTYNGAMTVMSYIEKKNSQLVILSSAQSIQFDQDQSGKPALYNFYQTTKDALSAKGKAASIRTTLRVPRQWQVELTYLLLDLVAINSHQIYQMNVDQIPVRNFVIALGKSLVRPELARRATAPGLHRELQDAIARVSGVSRYARYNEEDSEGTPARKRRRCRLCPAALGRKCSTVCEICHQPLCRSCSKISCKQCFHNTATST